MYEILLNAMQLAETVIDKTGSQASTAAAAPAGSGFQIPWLLMVSLAMLAFYFSLSRKQKKQDAETKEMRESIGVDDEIITAGGLFGKVVAVWHDSFLVEFGTNKGVSIPVKKSSVVSKMTPQMSEPATKSIEEKKGSQKK